MGSISMMLPEQRPPGGTSKPDDFSPSALDWAARVGAADEILCELEERSTRRRTRRRAAAASTVAILLLCLCVTWQSRKGNHDEISPKSAASVDSPIAPVVSSPRREVLSDGSIVELNTEAQIAVNFSDAFRRVALLRGEAHFQVAKNPARPFVVSAGGVAVQAVGTAFAVQLGGKAVEVLVTEGRVSVANTIPSNEPPASATNSPPAPLAFVDAGKLAVIDVTNSAVNPPPTVAQISDTELTQRLAWRVPRLDFSGTPLSEVLPLFNRYSRLHLSLADPALGDLRLSGILRADNTETLLRLLNAQFGITSTPKGENELVLQGTR